MTKKEIKKVFGELKTFVGQNRKSKMLMPIELIEGLTYALGEEDAGVVIQGVSHYLREHPATIEIDAIKKSGFIRFNVGNNGVKEFIRVSSINRFANYKRGGIEYIFFSTWQKDFELKVDNVYAIAIKHYMNHFMLGSHEDYVEMMPGGSEDTRNLYERKLYGL